MGDQDAVAAYWRDERIAELEAEGARKDARISELGAEVARKDVRISEFEGEVATLTAQMAAVTKQVTELMEKLGRNSRNSHLPPSSDSPKERKQRDKSSSGRKRGGQPGHGGSQRELLPEKEVDELVDLYPPECESCWTPLPKVPDRGASRYQQTELPPIKPRTTEWRRHQVTCPHCGYKTRAAHDEKVIPQSPFGPRLMAIMAMITGVYHVSRRSAVGLLSDLLGVRVSLGALSAVEARVGEAVQPAVDEAWAHVRGAGVKHTDGTSWYQAGLSILLGASDPQARFVLRARRPRRRVRPTAPPRAPTSWTTSPRYGPSSTPTASSRPVGSGTGAVACRRPLSVSAVSGFVPV
jgi:transposase/uncharacterized coiled-coil protein SlyX